MRGRKAVDSRNETTHYQKPDSAIWGAGGQTIFFFFFFFKIFFMGNFPVVNKKREGLASPLPITYLEGFLFVPRLFTPNPGLPSAQWASEGAPLEILGAFPIEEPWADWCPFGFIADFMLYLTSFLESRKKLRRGDYSTPP